MIFEFSNENEILLNTDHNIFDFQIACHVLGVAVMTSSINYWFSIPLVVVAAAAVYLRNIYLRTSRSVKRMEGTSKYNQS